jgi:hypothetical protein
MLEQGAHSVFDKLFGRPAFPFSRRICWLGSDTVKIPGQPAFLIRLSGRPGCLTNLKGLVSQRKVVLARVRWATMGLKICSNRTRTLFRRTVWSPSFPDQPTHLLERLGYCENFLCQPAFLIRLSGRPGSLVTVSFEHPHVLARRGARHEQPLQRRNGDRRALRKAIVFHNNDVQPGLVGARPPGFKTRSENDELPYIS